MRSRRLAPILFALALAAPPLRAQTAEDLVTARELFREGSKLAEAGDWEAARDRFARSLKLKRAALTFYNLGVAQQKTGRLVDAIESFRSFLAQPVEPTTEQYVEPVRSAVLELEGRVARVVLDIHPTGLVDLVLRVDGREVPRSPDPLRMDPGRHDIVVVATGYRQVRQDVVLVEGAQATVALTLAPDEALVTPGSAMEPLPAAFVIGGLATFVAGEVVFGVGVREGIGAGSDADSAMTQMLVGNIVAGVGVLAVGVGVVLFLTREPSRSESAGLHPWSSGSVAGVRLRF